jgi:hypothetical protein
MLSIGFRKKDKLLNNPREPMFCCLNHSDGLSALDTITENANGRQEIQIVNDSVVENGTESHLYP